MKQLARADILNQSYWRNTITCNTIKYVLASQSKNFEHNTGLVNCCMKFLHSYVNICLMPNRYQIISRGNYINMENDRQPHHSFKTQCNMALQRKFAILYMHSNMLTKANTTPYLNFFFAESKICELHMSK